MGDINTRRIALELTVKLYEAMAGAYRIAEPPLSISSDEITGFAAKLDDFLNTGSPHAEQSGALFRIENHLHRVVRMLDALRQGNVALYQLERENMTTLSAYLQDIATGLAAEGEALNLVTADVRDLLARNADVLSEADKTLLDGIATTVNQRTSALQTLAASIVPNAPTPEPAPTPAPADGGGTDTGGATGSGSSGGDANAASGGDDQPPGA